MKARFGQLHCFSYKIKLIFSMFFVQKIRKLSFEVKGFFKVFAVKIKSGMLDGRSIELRSKRCFLIIRNCIGIRIF